MRRFRYVIIALVLIFSGASSLSETALAASPQPKANIHIPRTDIFKAAQRHAVSPKVIEYALAYYQRNIENVKNRRYITVIDYSKLSSERRMLIIDLQTGKIESLLTAHGKNSDPDNDGRATIFSNEPGSKKTSLGFFLTSETYMGRHGLSLRLDGLDTSNSNARDRAIVIHGADYISNTTHKVGRSWGCPSVSNELAQPLIEKLKGGSLLFAYHPSFFTKVANAAN